MRKKILNIIIAAILTVSTVPGISCHDVYASSEAQGVFDGPFFYTDPTTTTYQFYSDNDAAAKQTYAPTIGKKTISKCATVTENQILPYYIHVPKNYDSSKKYPIITYCSGDGITVFSEDFGGSIVDFSKISTSSPLYTLIGSYLQTKIYYNAKWDDWGGCDAYNTDGTIKSNISGLPHYTANRNNYDDQFIENWYDLVYNQGEEDYDCFIIFLNPTDRFWFENTTNRYLVNIQNQAQSSELLSKYGNSIIKGLDDCSCANITSTYVSSELSANVYEQLLVQLIDNLSNKYSIDLSRQYLAGFSLGAMFSYDTACHYPDRFACVMTSGLPSVDLSDENCKSWINTNFWAFNGNSDYCDKNGLFVSEFVEKVNSYKTNDNNVKTYNTVVSGGHNGQYIAGQGERVSGHEFTSTSTYDFMFSSQKVDLTNNKNESNIECLKDTNLFVEISNANSSSYDMTLISNCPTGDFDEYGFIVTPNDPKTIVGYKSTNFVCEKGTSYTCGSISINAVDYESAYIIAKTISGVPDSITEFTVQTYASNGAGTTYGNIYKVTINNGVASVVEVN